MNVHAGRCCQLLPCYTAQHTQAGGTAAHCRSRDPSSRPSAPRCTARPRASFFLKPGGRRVPSHKQACTQYPITQPRTKAPRAGAHTGRGPARPPSPSPLAPASFVLGPLPSLSCMALGTTGFHAVGGRMERLCVVGGPQPGRARGHAMMKPTRRRDSQRTLKCDALRCPLPPRPRFPVPSSLPGGFALAAPPHKHPVQAPPAAGLRPAVPPPSRARAHGAAHATAGAAIQTANRAAFPPLPQATGCHGRGGPGPEGGALCVCVRVCLVCLPPLPLFRVRGPRPGIVSSAGRRAPARAPHAARASSPLPAPSPAPFAPVRSFPRVGGRWGDRGALWDDGREAAKG